MSEAYPRWNPEQFHLAGTGRIMTLIATGALAVAKLALDPDGTTCLLCGQHVQVYRRSIYKRMAECLVWLVSEHRKRGGEWVSLKSGPVFRGGDNTKLLYWKLIERHTRKTDLYRPTDLGVQFASRQLEIPKYAYVYDGKVQGFSKETVSILDCLGDSFDFGRLGLPPGGT